MDSGHKFVGANAEGLNALSMAFEKAAHDLGFVSVYAYLEKAPQTSLTAEVCKALRELGYKIVKED